MNLYAEELGEDLLPKAEHFECEYTYIGDYLRNPHDAYEDGKTGNTKTIVILNDNEEIVAYYSIKCSSLRVEDESGIYIHPSVEVVMFAVDIRYRKKGIGERTFSLILDHITKLRDSVGIRVVTLFSVPNAVGFYRDKFNFIELSEGMDMYLHPTCEGCLPMFLALPRMD